MLINIALLTFYVMFSEEVKDVSTIIKGETGLKFMIGLWVTEKSVFQSKAVSSLIKDWGQWKENYIMSLYHLSWIQMWKMASWKKKRSSLHLMRWMEFLKI